LYGRSGVVSLLLQNFGIFTSHIFGLPGLLIMQLTVSIPYAVFIMAAGLQGVPRHIDETASSLGVYPIRYIFEVIIPCIYPHIIISGLMIFLISIGDIGGPLVIGGGYAVLSSEIYMNFLSLLNDERIALILSLWIIVLSLLLLAGVTRLLRLTVKKYVPGTNPVIYKLKAYRVGATLGVFIIVLVLLLPFFVTCIQSVVRIWSFEIIPHGWTLANYRSILYPAKVFFDTFLMAALATAIIVMMSLILAHMLFQNKSLRFFNFFLIIPLVLPGIVLSVGVLRTYAFVFPKDHTIPFYLLLLFTIVIRRLPYSLKTLEAGFITADLGKEEIAISLGSSSLRAFCSITLPQIRTYIFAAIFIGIIKTATELSASLILAPLNWNSISLQIMNLIDQGALSKASALSVILVAIIGLGTFLVAFWSQGKGNAQQPYSAESLERLVLGRTPMSYYHKEKKHKSRWAVSLLKKKEPLLVVTDRLGIIEANESFLRMVGSDTLGQLQKESSFSMLFFGDKEVLEIFSSLAQIENRATSVMVLNGSRVPILLNAYVATSEDSTK
ncbi:MAG: iron ABC transporter permease, partial [Spirochaetia bacterium]|nr:iron ABC transporter permease [Spirochaetia bacterium]